MAVPYIQSVRDRVMAMHLMDAVCESEGAEAQDGGHASAAGIGGRDGAGQEATAQDVQEGDPWECRVRELFFRLMRSVHLRQDTVWYYVTDADLDGEPVEYEAGCVPVPDEDDCGICPALLWMRSMKNLAANGAEADLPFLCDRDGGPDGMSIGV